MPRLLLLGICVFAPLLNSGCLYCAYPRIDYTPPIRLDALTEIHAFRVDTTTQGIVAFGGFIPSREDQLWKLDEYILPQTICELSGMPTGEIPAQIKPSVSYGLLYPILVVNALVHTSHSVSIRLYRPGYQLVELNSWDKSTPITWKACPELENQEKTVDRLTSGPLEPGSVSNAHRKALLFGADEYSRLARVAPSTELQVRLTEKAIKLREQAEK